MHDALDSSVEGDKVWLSIFVGGVILKEWMLRFCPIYQLCGYCDASKSVYAAALYLLKKQSIPRLELVSAVLLERLMDVMKANLSSDLKISCHCFTDSQFSVIFAKDMRENPALFHPHHLCLHLECKRLFHSPTLV